MDQESLNEEEALKDLNDNRSSIASESQFKSLPLRNFRGTSFRSKNSFGNVSNSVLQDAVEDPEFLEQLLGPKPIPDNFQIHEEEDLDEALQ